MHSFLYVLAESCGMTATLYLFTRNNCIFPFIVLYLNKEKSSKGEMNMARYEYIAGRLGYNSSNDRYGLLVMDIWEDTGFHCGECLEAMVDGEWVQTRMEMTWGDGKGEWYLVGTPYKGDLEYVRARIRKQIY